MMAALQGADALLIVTEWKMFRAPDFDASRPAEAAGDSGWPQYVRPAWLRELGFDYQAIGR
jgi:UDPglucose 6-dehydrogenase